jgi:hypothetical protein
MDRTVLQACLPWMIGWTAVCAALILLVWLVRARLEISRLRHLHADQGGSAQTLSFVLTLPLFVILIMLIVQISQVMIGTIVVHYAAFAAARAAIVWIPAQMQGEDPNCIGEVVPDPQAGDTAPVADSSAAGYGPGGGGMHYKVAPVGLKYEKIAIAARLACMPISPSKDYGFSQNASLAGTLQSLDTVYKAIAPQSAGNSMIDKRLANKLGYSWGHSTFQMSTKNGAGAAGGAPSGTTVSEDSDHTRVEISFYHTNQDPYLLPYDIPPYPAEFEPNEVGWEDPITVTVTHYMAMMPGPGKVLFQWLGGQGGQGAQVYVYKLSAQCTLGNEGQKSVYPYAY